MKNVLYLKFLTNLILHHLSHQNILNPWSMQICGIPQMFLLDPRCLLLHYKVFTSHKWMLTIGPKMAQNDLWCHTLNDFFLKIHLLTFQGFLWWPKLPIFCGDSWPQQIFKIKQFFPHLNHLLFWLKTKQPVFKAVVLQKRAWLTCILAIGLKLYTYIILHSEAQIFNCKNKKKNYVWLKGGFKYLSAAYMIL